MHRFFRPKETDCPVSPNMGMLRDLTRLIAQSMAAEEAVETKEGVNKLLEEAFNNGTLDIALSLPATPKPCPNISSSSIQAKVRSILEDCLACGSLGRPQAEQLTDLLHMHNMLFAQQQAAKHNAAICDFSREGNEIGESRLPGSKKIAMTNKTSIPRMHETYYITADDQNSQEPMILKLFDNVPAQRDLAQSKCHFEDLQKCGSDLELQLQTQERSTDKVQPNETNHNSKEQCP